MHDPYFSVIIPTHNRAEKLGNCLRALKAQTLSPESFEVIVVDDGSQDDTGRILKEWATSWPTLRVVHQKNAGQGNARNHGIQIAVGQIVVFLGDDIYAQPDFLEKHSDFHQEHPGKEWAALGLTVWDPSELVTPFMKWMTHGGPQFAYHHLKPHEEASFWYFYTSNLSLKHELLMEDRFDPAFRGYGWEDIELGYRLSQKGLKLVFLPEALALHDHFLEESSLKARMTSIGESAVLFQKKYPEVSVIPKGIIKWALMFSSSWLILAFLHFLKILIPRFVQRYYWYLLSKRYFFKGLRSI